MFFIATPGKPGTWGYEYDTLTSFSAGVFEVSPVDSLARHWRYLPEGSPELTGDGQPAAVHTGVESSMANSVSEALTWNVISVPETISLSHSRRSQRALGNVVSKTCDAMVPNDVY